MVFKFENKECLTELLYYSIINRIIVKMIPPKTSNSFRLASINDMHNHDDTDLKRGMILYKNETKDPKNVQPILSITHSDEHICVVMTGIAENLGILIGIANDGIDIDFKGIEDPELKGDARNAAEFIYDIVRSALTELAEHF